MPGYAERSSTCNSDYQDIKKDEKIISYCYGYRSVFVSEFTG
ncbi:hypothetical protein Pvag_pPag30360 (plasmid) [Pantoea vagans C9-1]|nr:hypothetical protein Pvag_pPag30360 [Pantoea vagans C9-1]